MVFQELVNLRENILFNLKNGVILGIMKPWYNIGRAYTTRVYKMVYSPKNGELVELHLFQKRINAAQNPQTGNGFLG